MDMSKWEIAQSLIDAKRVIDSLMYISNNIAKLGNLDIRSKTKALNDAFYISLCVVLDKTLGKKKKAVCEGDSVIGRIYYERDKHAAHRDKSYKKREYASFSEEIAEKKNEILHVRKVCCDLLPSAITLDFVPHDRDLFRQIHHITPEKEEEIKRIKHPNYKRQENYEGIDSKSYHVLYDIEDVGDLSETEKNDYCDVMEAGLNSYEGVQNRQDACIRINVLYNQNMWASVNYDALELIEEMKKSGLLDEFEIPRKSSKKNKEAKAFIKKMIEKMHYNK